MRLIWIALLVLLMGSSALAGGEGGKGGDSFDNQRELVLSLLQEPGLVERGLGLLFRRNPDVLPACASGSRAEELYSRLARRLGWRDFRRLELTWQGNCREGALCLNLEALTGLSFGDSAEGTFRVILSQAVSTLAWNLEFESPDLDDSLAVGECALRALPSLAGSESSLEPAPNSAPPGTGAPFSWLKSRLIPNGIPSSGRAHRDTLVKTIDGTRGLLARFFSACLQDPRLSDGPEADFFQRIQARFPSLASTASRGDDFTLQAEETCSEDGIEKSASWDPGTHVVCLSLSKLLEESQWVDPVRLKRLLLADSIHELGHGAGLTEDQCRRASALALRAPDSEFADP